LDISGQPIAGHIFGQALSTKKALASAKPRACCSVSLLTQLSRTTHKTHVALDPKTMTAATPSLPDLSASVLQLLHRVQVRTTYEYNNVLWFVLGARIDTAGSPRAFLMSGFSLARFLPLFKNP